jgi:NhaP-type Na+/H+ or K+/H+ antiporter
VKGLLLIGFVAAWGIGFLSRRIARSGWRREPKSVLLILAGVLWAIFWACAAVACLILFSNYDMFFR